MLIKISKLKGQYRIFSNDGDEISVQPDFDCALAFVQGRIDRNTGEVTNRNTIEIQFDYHKGHRAKEFKVLHCGTAEYLIGSDNLPDAVSLLMYCAQYSPNKSFVATIYLSDSHYTFNRENDRANEIYYEERLGLQDLKTEDPK